MAIKRRVLNESLTNAFFPGAAKQKAMHLPQWVAFFFMDDVQFGNPVFAETRSVLVA
jgi:hypothetical protein